MRYDAVSSVVGTMERGTLSVLGSGRKRVQKPTPGVLKHHWARSMPADAPTVSFPDLPPPWSDIPPTYCDKLGLANGISAKTLAASESTAYERLDLQSIHGRHTEYHQQVTLY